MNLSSDGAKPVRPAGEDRTSYTLSPHVEKAGAKTKTVTLIRVFPLYYHLVAHPTDRK